MGFPAVGLDHGGEINIKREQVLCRANSNRVPADGLDFLGWPFDMPRDALEDIADGCRA
jgi:hypothetical protein